MKIFGHEYGMLYSVGAQQEIAALCPGKDIAKLPEALRATETESGAERTARLPLILSKWHERAESAAAKAEGREYAEKPLTWEQIELLDQDQFVELIAEAFTAMANGRQRSVEADAEPEKKTETTAAC